MKTKPLIINNKNYEYIISSDDEIEKNELNVLELNDTIELTQVVNDIQSEVIKNENNG